MRSAPGSRSARVPENRMIPEIRKCRIGIVGLGYVGLPLAVEFGKHYDTIGFDVKAERIAQLRRGRDATLERHRAELKEATRLTFTTDLNKPEALSGLHRDRADADR